MTGIAVRRLQVVRAHLRRARFTRRGPARLAELPEDRKTRDACERIQTRKSARAGDRPQSVQERARSDKARRSGRETTKPAEAGEKRKSPQKRARNEKARRSGLWMLEPVGSRAGLRLRRLRKRPGP